MAARSVQNPGKMSLIASLASETEGDYRRIYALAILPATPKRHRISHAGRHGDRGVDRKLRDATA